MNKEYNR